MISTLADYMMHQSLLCKIWAIGIFLFMGLMTKAEAQNAVLIGKVVNEKGIPVINVAVHELGTGNGVFTDSTGSFTLNLTGKDHAGIRATLLGYEKNSFNIHFHNGDTLRRTIQMRQLLNILDTVGIRDQSIRNQAGMTKIDISHVDQLPSTVGGIEGLLKILVGSNNELTSQYTVRGGNYDENLVYVDGFEIYRPFLITSGQQEGLSFVNSDLVQSVDFSVGGFQAKYGDKMSSVLDVGYKTPEKFAGSVMLSLLGINAHLEGASKNKKFSYLLGIRQKSDQYLLQSQPTKGQYNPSFTDFQGAVHYKFSPKWDWEILANYARNRFNFIPEEQVSAFGYVNEVYQLHTFFNGNEKDKFDTYFGGTNLRFEPNDKLALNLRASTFRTREFQTYDIFGEYGLYEVESDLGKTDFGQTKASLGSGAIHDFARDYLTADVAQFEHSGSYDAGRNFFMWGAKLKRVMVNDQMLEWERRDSAGYSLPFNEHAINFVKLLNANNDLDYTTISGYLQDNILLNNANNMTLNIGVRVNHDFLNKETIISPRAQFAVTPKWKRDIVFRFAAGIYDQPPFYQEMRDLSGVVNTNLKSQKSFQVAAGFDYNFKAWDDRPFKLTGEVYYKNLWDLVPYEYDNIAIRYYAQNSAKGYAYGAEMRLYGDLVKGTPSWVSVGFLKTENRIFNDTTGTYGSWMPRPTDQRLNFGLFFSDYLPRNKNFKMYLNTIYTTGLPFSPPGKATDPLYSKLRIPDYKRVDIGFSALLLEKGSSKRHAYSLFNAFNSIWLSLEVFNLLGIQNTISYTWIQDFSTNRIYAVPDRLTNRLLNLKLELRF